MGLDAGFGQNAPKNPNPKIMALGLWFCRAGLELAWFDITTPKKLVWIIIHTQFVWIIIHTQKIEPLTSKSFA